MWSEKWGEMIWGGGSNLTVQVPFGPWTLLFLGFVLGVCAVYANRSRLVRVVPFVMVLLVPVVSVIAMNLPYTFQNSTVADANEVNANFAALNSAVDEATASFVLLTQSPFSTVFFDQSDLNALCGDADGCTMRICGDINPLQCHAALYSQQNPGARIIIRYFTGGGSLEVNGNGTLDNMWSPTGSGCTLDDADNLSGDDSGSAMRLRATSTWECVIRFDD